jgi:subtilisin family serine protease
MPSKPSKPKRRAGKAKPRPRNTSGADFPDRIFANASPRSVGGVSMLEAGAYADVGTIGNFVSEPEYIERAVNLLSDAGFEVLHANAFMINIAGPRELYESAFGTSLVAEERPTIKRGGEEDAATFIDTTDTPVSGLCSTAGTRFDEVLEGVAIEEPAYLATPNPFPPTVDYFRLDVPADVSLGCNADRAHRAGITGRGINVAMVDTGWQEHPFFTQRGYRADPVVLGPGAADPAIDPNGHGTGESANVFATAPDARLQPVKVALSATGSLVNATGAFNAGVALNPHIITNSWSANIQFGPLSAASQARAAAVAAAWAAGIVVVFAAGNGSWGFPGQHPDVISVGGVDIRENGTLRASNYASGFMSNIYAGRRVPDLSGLVGMLPNAMSIMLPLPEGCTIDAGNSGGSWPNGDETANNDGWAAFSGTSAATPQIAGVCALIKQACPSLSPPEVRNILMTTARDVTTGTNHPNFGNAAVAGPDTATGNGLVDANKAVLVAKVRCISVPLRPIFPPLQPITPALPLQPFTPTLPFRPLTPAIPLQPFLPAVPLQPLTPAVPFAPALPFQPVQPFQPFGPLTPAAGLSSEDLAALEEMIIASDDFEM